MVYAASINSPDGVPVRAWSNTDVGANLDAFSYSADRNNNIDTDADRYADCHADSDADTNAATHTTVRRDPHAGDGFGAGAHPGTDRRAGRG